jgi:hypothetical protein
MNAISYMVQLFLIPAADLLLGLAIRPTPLSATGSIFTLCAGEL